MSTIRGTKARRTRTTKEESACMHAWSAKPVEGADRKYACNDAQMIDEDGKGSYEASRGERENNGFDWRLGFRFRSGVRRID